MPAAKAKKQAKASAQSALLQPKVHQFDEDEVDKDIESLNFNFKKIGKQTSNIPTSVIS